jgi:hypothetical protein
LKLFVVKTVFIIGTPSFIDPYSVNTLSQVVGTVLLSSFIVTQPNKFKLKVFGRSNCLTIQTNFKLVKEFLPLEYVNFSLKIQRLYNFKFYSFLSIL